MTQTMEKQQLFFEVEDCIRKSLLEEVYTTPKPGLVDQRNNGAHNDMNIRTFLWSTQAVSPYLGEMCWQGYHWKGALQQLFIVIQKIGKAAEQAMYRETGNVNTHKGAIFTIGLLAAAAGVVYQRKGTFSTPDILKTAGDISKYHMELFFEKLENNEAVTNGENLYKVYGIKGIRGEAGDGFPIIAKTAYPALCKYEKMFLDDNRVRLLTLLEIMTRLTDTNILSRSEWDFTKLRWMQEKAAEILSGDFFSGDMLKELYQWDEECIRENLSPGGCADILAATLFLRKLEKIQ